MTGPVRTLLIEDDADDALLTREMLGDIRGSTFDIHHAPTYDEGLRQLLSGQFDVCLLDHRLGARTGIDLIREAVAAGADCPIILFTGQGDETLAVAALQLGARDYLVKGRVTPKALQRAIGNAIEKHTMERALAAHRAELEQANRELARKNADIQGFHHTVSHELKTPLTVAREFADILIEGLAGPLGAEQAEYLGIIRASCDHMATMINDLLDSSRIENGKLALHREPVDAAELVSGAVRAMGPAARERGIALACDCSGGLPALHADPARLNQVLANLIGNALKFTPPGGAVRVSVAPDPDGAFLRIAVSDNGVGIRADKLDAIFQRFYQVDDRRDQEKGGLGLGLSICKGIVDLHGGHIQVTSRAGTGSTFSCLLPTAPPEAAPPAPGSPPAPRSGSG
ncbi:MAG: response regulator [Nitrospirae bacterium]|nr:response regulator [Nitrospirota bacterium]